MQRLQAIVATGHAGEIVAANSSCGDCGGALPRKGSATIVYRIAFGKLGLACPRLYSRCRCYGAGAYAGESFSPLALILAQRTHPELLCLQTRWASNMSYERAARLSGDVLPLGAAPRSSSIKAQVRKAGGAMVTEAYDSAEHFFDAQPLVFPKPPTSQPAHVLEIDAGYIRAVANRCGGRKSFGIISSRLIKLDDRGSQGAVTSAHRLLPVSGCVAPVVNGSRARKGPEEETLKGLGIRS